MTRTLRARVTLLPLALTLSLVGAALTAPQINAIPACDVPFSGGAGSSGDPYQIGTSGDLDSLRLHPYCFDNHFVQTANISAGIGFTSSIGTDVAPFSGSYNGSGKTIDQIAKPLFGVVEGGNISGLTIVGSLGSGYTIYGAGGLIEVLLQGSVSDVTVGTNFVIPNAPVTEDERTIVAGGIVGIVGKDGGASATTTISDGTFNGSAAGSRGVGGIVGHVWGNATLTIDRASVSGFAAEGQILGEFGVGGLVGYASSSVNPLVINDSSSSALVRQDVLSSGWIGGLVGGSARAEPGGLSINRSVATGSVTGLKGIVGGLVGTCEGQCQIAGSSATGDVTVAGSKVLNDGVGGLVGYLRASSASSITDSHAEGDVRVLLPNESGSQAEGVGGLVGKLIHGPTRVTRLITVSNSYATGLVEVNSPNASDSVAYVGGFVGQVDFVDIQDSYSSADVTSLSGEAVGGFVGFASNSSLLSDVWASGNVHGARFVGGFVGKSENSVFERSSGIGSVAGRLSGSGAYVGGLTGKSNFDAYVDSYARGSVSGWGIVGGVFGESDTPVLARLYATGLVTDASVGAYVGGVAGKVPTPPRASGVYWDFESTGQISPTGSSSAPIPATPLTTEQMQSENSFEGWDFNTVWGYQCSTSIYPQLRSANPYATRTSCPEPPPRPSPNPENGGTTGDTETAIVSTLSESTPSPSVGVDSPQALGTSSMTIDGQSVSIEATRQTRGQGIAFSAGGMNFNIQSQTGTGRGVPLAPDGSLVIARSGGLPTSGSGLAPGSSVTQTLFSDPTSLGVTTVDASGNFGVTPIVPSNVPRGKHTLNLVGITKFGEPFSLSIGVTVTSPSAALGADPLISLSPRSVSSGDVVRVTARQVQAQCLVAFSMGKVKTTTRASSQGVAIAILRVPVGKKRASNLVTTVSGKGCTGVKIVKPLSLR